MNYSLIEQISEKGNSYYEEHKFGSALNKYNEALVLVPSPKESYEASTWLYTSIADCYYSLDNLDDAKENYYNALNCPNGLANGYINLSLGITLFELEESEKSQEFLLRAYMLEGEEIFEDEDEKYFNSIRHLI